MEEIKTNARQAGLLYLALAAIAPFSLSYVPSVLADAGSISAKTLAAHETLLRMSLVSELVYQVLEIWIVLALFELFRGTNRPLSRQMLVLGLLPIPIIFLNEIFSVGAIMISTGQLAVEAPSVAAQNIVAVLLYYMHQTGLVIASIFWGLWLIPLGRLIIASDAMPSPLGWSVIVGGLGYVLRATAILSAPIESANQLVLGLTEFMILGEIPVIAGLLWLGFGQAKQKLSSNC